VHSTEYLLPVFFNSFEMLIALAVDYLGPLPLSWRNRFDRSKYGEPVNWQQQDAKELDWWHTRQAGTKLPERLSTAAQHLSSDKREHFLRLLCAMVAYEPGNRPSATAVLEQLTSIANSA
jgi:hypothetical protein